MKCSRCEKEILVRDSLKTMTNDGLYCKDCYEHLHQSQPPFAISHRSPLEMAAFFDGVLNGVKLAQKMHPHFSFEEIKDIAVAMKP